MPDSTFQRFSAMPVDSLSDRQFQMLMLEKQAQLQHESNANVATALGIMGIVTAIGLIVYFGTRDRHRVTISY